MARKRELIEPNPGDKRYIRRDAQGRFTASQVDVSRSLAADNNQKAKTNVPKGQGDKGDHRKKIASRLRTSCKILLSLQEVP